MRLSKYLVASIALLISAGTASATYIQPDWARPTSVAQAAQTKTTFQHWDAYSSKSSNVPDIAVFNPTGTPNSFDANGVAGVTTSGNLYAGSQIIRMNNVIPSYGDPFGKSTKFLLQITSTANALFTPDGLWIAAEPANPIENDFSKLLVNGQRVDTLPSFSVQRLAFTQGSSATSFNYERAIKFELPGSLSSYNIEWTAPKSSTGMAAVAVDTLTVVPEPTSIALLAAGGLLALGRRRRRV